MVNMVNRKYLALIALTFLFISCVGPREKSQEALTLSITKDSVLISNTSAKQYKLTICILDKTILSEDMGESKSLSLLELVRKCTDKREIALSAVKNFNKIPINIKIGESVDTLVSYTIEPYNEEETLFSISGQCAPLVSEFSSTTRSVEHKRWLFRKKAYLEDEQVEVFTGLVNQLSRSNSTEYVTNSTIPVLHNLADIKYNVHTNMDGEHFVLFAAKSSKEIDEFVEEVVANDFELCSENSSGTMSCYRDINSNGYMCISLIAIKNDWSYNIQPLGLIAIDNMAPNEGRDDNITSFSFPNNVNVILPTDKPEIYGQANIRVLNWDGNGLWCNVTFLINAEGDVKSITVERTKELCNYYPYLGYTDGVKPLKQTFLMKDVGANHTFNLKLHFEDGDNYIPFMIEDYHGNVTKGQIIQRAEFVRSNTPSINIDNNVNVYD